MTSSRSKLHSMKRSKVKFDGILNEKFPVVSLFSHFLSMRTKKGHRVVVQGDDLVFVDSASLVSSISLLCWVSFILMKICVFLNSYV